MVVATRPDVPPVAVIVFDPPVVSATAVAALSAQEPKVPTVDPVTQLKDVVVHIVVATVTDSAEPKPVIAIDGVIDSSGKPKLLPV